MNMRVTATAVAALMVAVAAGVVLGSGPLRTALVGQHGEQMRAVEQERDIALERVDQEQAQSRTMTEFLDHVTPALVEGSLVDEGVAIVIVGEVDPAIVAQHEFTLAAAGAEVVSVLTLTDAWFDPAQVAFRSALGTQIGAALGQSGEEADQAPSVETALTTLLRSAGSGPEVVVGDPDVPNGVGAAQVTAELLEGAGVLEGTAPERDASAVVFVVGEIDGDTEIRSATIDGAAAVASALRDDGAGVAIAAVDAADRHADALRDSARLLPTVSTVAGGDTPVGRALVALVLRHQLDDGQGHFGGGEGRELAP